MNPVSTFDEIFEIAKKTVNLDRFGSGVRMYYIRGKAVKRIIGALLLGIDIGSASGNIKKILKMCVFPLIRRLCGITVYNGLIIAGGLISIAILPLLGYVYETYGLN